LSLTAAQKARVVSLAKKRVPSDRVLWLFDPVNDRFLPATCDEQGFIKIDPEELDSRYHKKNENIDVGDLDANNSLDVVFGSQDVVIRAYNDHLYIQNKAHSANRNFSAGGGIYYGTLQFFSNLGIRYGYIHYSNKSLMFDKLDEYTANAGVTIEGVLHKDYNVTAHRLLASRAAAGNPAISVQVDGDTEADSRLQIRADGMIQWGSGAAAVDVNLYRSSANVLKTDDTFHCDAISIANLTIGQGLIRSHTGFADGVAGGVGVDGSWTAGSGETITVSGGIVTGIV
jgi:hypothetical protein